MPRIIPGLFYYDKIFYYDKKGENRKMNKQQQTVLNMAGFIKSQSLTLLEKLDALDADEQAAMCEKLHELAEELQNSIQTRFEAENLTGI